MEEPVDALITSVHFYQTIRCHIHRTAIALSTLTVMRGVRRRAITLQNTDSMESTISRYRRNFSISQYARNFTKYKVRHLRVQ
jgi:hypothetical protein